MMKFDASVDEDAIRLAVTKALKENTACTPTVLNNFFDDGSTSEVSVQKNLIRGAKMSPEFQKKFDEAEAENLKKLERLSNQSNKRGYNGSN